MNKKTVSGMLLTLLQIGILTSAFNVQQVKAPALARLYLDPVVSVALPGETFTVDLMVADVALLYAWQVNMSFNPSVLQFVNVTEGPFLKDQPEGTWTAHPVVGYSWVVFGWMTKGPYLGVSGSGCLATVEFLVLNIGESILNIDDPLTKLFRYNPPPLPPGEEPIEPIPHTRENGYFRMRAHDITSGWLSFSVTFDGKMTTAEEWSDTTPVDLTLLEWHVGPGTVSAKVWIKNDDTWLYMLYRVEWLVGDIDPFDGGYIDYFWDWIGCPPSPCWNHSDFSFIEFDGVTFDLYGWNETRWKNDLNASPPGENNVEGAATHDGTYYWFEFRKELNSGDGYDWSFTSGEIIETVGQVHDLLVGVWDDSTQDVYEAYISLYLSTPTWEHVFEDERRSTTLKLSTDDKHFQFIAPEKEFSIKQDQDMIVTDHFIFIYFRDSEIVLWSFAVVTPKWSFCLAIARDVETGTRYLLLDLTVVRPVEPPPSVPL